MVKLEKKQTHAYWPRGPGLSISMADKLELVYLKYSAEKSEPEKACTVINFIFAHGTGMNKSLWKSHIEELYRKNDGNEDWTIGSVISVDAAGHGDSGLLNKGKIAWGNDWRDGAKDLIEVVKHEINTTGEFLPSAYTRNILVGHSMGGFQATYAAFLEPALFDACVAIEPVIFVDEGAGPFFIDRMKKIGKILREQFSSREDADRFFKKQSFYKVMDPRVLADFVDDEVYFENGVYKTKATNDSQLATYLSGLYSIQFGQNILSLLEVPYLFITGTQAGWNLPNSDEHVETSVPEHLLERAKLEGDHLVHGLNVTGTVDEIYRFAERRAEFVKLHRDDFPEIKYKNDHGSKVKSMFEHMWSGNVARAFRWDRPAPKL